MGWHTCNMNEIQTPNRIIDFIGTTRHLVTPQAINWTQQLYKNKNMRVDAQWFHHSHPDTSLATTTVTDTMKIYPFCEETNIQQLLNLHGDSIHMYTHYSNTQLQQTRDVSNIDTALAQKHIGVLSEHTPYLLTATCVPFQTSLCSFLHQYDDNTRHKTSPIDTNYVHPYQRTTLDPRSYRSITPLVTDWNMLRPHMTQDSPDVLTYTHSLVSSFPPANYNQATIRDRSHLYWNSLTVYPRDCSAAFQHFCHITAPLVDDKRQYTNDWTSNLLLTTINNLQSVAHNWEYLLYTSGGKLENSNYVCYFISWTFSNDGTSKICNNTSYTINLLDLAKQKKTSYKWTSNP